MEFKMEDPAAVKNIAVMGYDITSTPSTGTLPNISSTAATTTASNILIKPQIAGGLHNPPPVYDPAPLSYFNIKARKLDGDALVAVGEVMSAAQDMAEDKYVESEDKQVLLAQHEEQMYSTERSLPDTQVPNLAAASIVTNTEALTTPPMLVEATDGQPADVIDRVASYDHVDAVMEDPFDDNDDIDLINPYGTPIPPPLSTNRPDLPFGYSPVPTYATWHDDDEDSGIGMDARSAINSLNISDPDDMLRYDDNPIEQQQRYALQVWMSEVDDRILGGSTEEQRQNHDALLAWIDAVDDRAMVDDELDDN